MSQLNVAQITLSMGQGGIENLLISLVENQASEHFKTYVYCLDYGGELLPKIESLVVLTRVFKRKPGIDWQLIVALAKCFKKDDIDIVHTHNEASHFYGCLAALLVRKPVVVNTEHSRHYVDGHWRRRLEKKLLSFVTKKIIAVSDELLTASIERDWISPKKLTVVANGVDLKRFLTRPRSELIKLKQELGIQPNVKIITIIARLNPIKNHALLLDAFALLCRTTPLLNLLIVGDGGLRSELEKLSNKLGIANQVTFLGNRSDIPELLAITDVLVLCSHREGLPLVLLEGMAARVPIVVTQGANRSGVIKNQISGFVCEACTEQLAENILYAVDSKTTPNTVDNAEAVVNQDYSIAKTVSLYETIYQKVLD